MTMLTRFDPVGEALSLRQAMERLFDDSFVNPSGWLTVASGQVSPLVDVYETNDDIVVEASMPGLSADNVNISLTGQTLVLRGELQAGEQAADARYLIRERRFGSFQRQIALPVRVDGDHAEATFEHGVLTLRIPKAAEVKPRQIQIKTGEAQKQLK